MLALFSIFNGSNGPMMASVVAFVAFFLVARLVDARQTIALAFGLLPLLLFFAVETAATLA